MMVDLHTHTVFSDGKAAPEAMVLAALERGVDTIGISDHSHTFFDERYCMKKADYPAYFAEIARLKTIYAGRIRVLCGIEQDYWSDTPTAGADYVIGSVHYIRCGEADYRTVDSGKNAEIGIGFLKSAANDYFGGDLYAVAEAYYRTVADVVNKTGADIIGHFDLITKFNDGGGLFDETHPRYKKAATEAIDALVPFGKPFEINTGAVSRGVKKTPYPSRALRDYIIASGGRFVLASDAHAPEHVAFGFRELAAFVSE